MERLKVRMRLGRINCLRLVAGLLICSLGSAIHAQESPRDASADSLAESLGRLTEDVQPMIELAGVKSDVLVKVSSIVRSLDLPGPDQKVLVEALAALRQLGGLDGVSRDFHRELGLAADRLRTELLNPWATNMRKLSDDLHHSLGHAAIAEHRQGTGALTESFHAMLFVQRSLEELSSRLSFASREDAARIWMPPVRERDQQHRMNEAFHALDAFKRDVYTLTERLRIHSRISQLIHGSMGDLDTFQNAIGLTKAKEKLRDANGTAAHPDTDPQLRAAVAFGLERVEKALLSPSSTDMELLREELHHGMIHPTDIVRLRDAVELQRHLTFVIEEHRKVSAAASQLAGALAAATNRELSAADVRYVPQQR